jgi:hypothetical protein
MIQINLVPDVKQELIKAQRVRAAVISMSIIIASAALAVVVLLAIYVFGAQTVRNGLADNNINDLHQQLQQDEDLPHVLTIQHQLSLLSDMHTNKKIHSRLFDILAATNSPSPNNIMISNLKLDTESNTITIEAQALGGYRAAEIYQKTIERSAIRFLESGETQTVPLASNITVGDASYGQDSSGTRVLRFTISFEYAEEVFARELQNAQIIGPNRNTNVTDSYLRLPQGLFADPAVDIEEEN